MQRDITIYMKNNDVIYVKNVYQFGIYHKANILEIATQHGKNKNYHLKIRKYDLNDITQIDIMTKINEYCMTDFILL